MPNNDWRRATQPTVNLSNSTLPTFHHSNLPPPPRVLSCLHRKGLG
jgi:hypothetical protein